MKRSPMIACILNMYLDVAFVYGSRQRVAIVMFQQNVKRGKVNETNHYNAKKMETEMQTVTKTG